MEILTDAFYALWQVTVVALLLGAGLPALFALGIRSLSAGHLTSPGGPPRDPAQPVSSVGKIGAIVCFGIVIAAALFGIVVIVFGKQLFG